MSIFNSFRLKLNGWKMRLNDWRERRRHARFHLHDERLVQQLSGRKRLPSWSQLKYLSEYLTNTERLILRATLGVLIVAVASLLLNLYWINSQAIPKVGDSYTEGLVGTPRYINPVFCSVNDVDADLSSLVFSGLLKYSNNGLIKDLASDYQISADQKTYTFKLRTDAFWHDGTKLTATDVVFTFNRIKEPKTRSPLYYNFNGVSVEKIDDATVKFTLTQPFAPFLESLTVGILPEHIWTNIAPENMLLAEYNLKPVGDGPYQFKSLTKDKDGNIKAFTVSRNARYYAGAPYINELSFKFIEDFNSAVEALNNKNVEGLSYLPKELRDRVINNRNLNFHVLQLPQYTAVFFNYEKSPILQDATIRKILTHATDKNKIVNEELNAEAQPIDGCVLPNTLGFCADTAKYPFDINYARQQLDKAGWKLSDYPATDNSTAPYPYP
ncbi:MAG: ABC transporter substrate-binding protein, partial [Parcubacteria group bacterium]